MSLRVFVSSDSNDSFFVDNTFAAIDEKSVETSSAIGILIEKIFPPRQTTIGMAVHDKVTQIRDANLVLMNITPNVMSEQYFVNSGVLIEYGIVVGLGEKEKLSMFCDQTIERQRLSPIFHGHDIQSFVRADAGVQLKSLVKNILTDHIRTIVDRSRQLLQDSRTTHAFIRQQLEADGTSRRTS